MNQHLLSCVIESICFFANSDDEQCDPDAAVAMLETIGRNLQELSPSELQQFKDLVVRMSTEAADEEMADCLLGIPEQLGL